jgi:aminotransferase EvaB
MDTMEVKFSHIQQQFAYTASHHNPARTHLDLDVEKILGDIRILVSTGEFTLGTKVEQFEQEFAKLCGTKYAVGVNSGTDALILTLKSLNIGKGDYVITVPNTFIATVAAIVHVGATPVFVDVDNSYGMDLTKVSESILRDTRAIIPVHLEGNPVDMVHLMRIAKLYGLYVIEDSAQAIGASVDGQSVGSFGHAGAFSLQPLSNPGLWGDGGMITTSSEDIYNKVKLLRNHGLRNRDEVEIFGFNSRLDALQAVVGLNLLPHLENITSARISNANFYDQTLSDLSPDFVTIPPRHLNIKQFYNTYIIQVERRGELLNYLKEKGIEAKSYRPIPIHLQPSYKDLLQSTQVLEDIYYKTIKFPVAERQAQRTIALPVHQHISETQLEYVTDVIHNFYLK